MNYIWVICAVLSFISYSFGLKCQTCRGGDCNKKSEIPLQECSFRHPFPLYESKTAFVTADFNYRCLQFSYVKDNNVEEVKQCIVVDSQRNVCEDLKNSFDVKSCSVRVPLQAFEDGDDTAPTPESTTSIPESTTSIPESTTSIPESTTSLPESTTSISESTTSIPESTTSTPQSTTSTPQSTTSTPQSTTSTPQSTTSTTKSTTSSKQTTASTTESTTSTTQSTTSSTSGSSDSSSSTESSSSTTPSSAVSSQTSFGILLAAIFYIRWM
ncbi:A-agglutinin anchorage subunit-like [Tribolium madens]|uniref:A-agglutinin anchorage subunit-like n=1 Tax=Tribolium madens TaxID=41895 RepID=UPI001CF73474|nr:A-agglutinin anchorage subunit-like [Tribolium madens]